jgi:hypothetical protein
MRKACKLQKKGKYWYWQAPTSPKWKSTRLTNMDKAEKQVLKVPCAPLLDAEQATLRQYLNPYSPGDTCPHVARFRAGGKQIREGRVRQARLVLDMRVLTDALADMPVGRIKRAHVLDFRQRVLKAKGPASTRRPES